MESNDQSKELLPVIATGLTLAVCAWLLPALVTLAHARELPRASAVELVAGTVRVVAGGELSQPRRSYPVEARAQMPDGRSWWLGPLGVVVFGGLFGLLVWQRLEPARARALLGRRPYDPRGAAPREWGRPRDLRDLQIRRRADDRFTLGRLDGRTLATDDETHIAVIAPTRSGKTTRCVIPWLLEHPGPAIVTSTKRDIHDATVGWRSRLGRVHVWDPGSADSAAWTPLDGCHEWSFALRQGLWLADAVDHGDHHAARYWNGEAAKLLAPLLHAAALANDHIATVIGWLDAQEVDEPAAILQAHGANQARRQFEAVAGLDPRNRGTTYMSAGSLLAAYRHPGVLATATPGFRADTFLDGGAHTLYLCAAASRQRELAPLIVSIVSSIFDQAALPSRLGPLTPTLRVLLDEAANIAPLRELPGHLSQASAHGIRIASIWQSLAQVRERYGDAADSILANSTAKLFMGPITDQITRAYLDQLLGEQVPGEDGRQRSRPLASAQAMQQLGRDRALLVAGAAQPAVVGLTPYWRDRELVRRAR